MTPAIPRRTVEPSEAGQLLELLQSIRRDVDKLQRGAPNRYSSISGGEGTKVYDDAGQLRLSIDPRGTVTAYDGNEAEVARYGRLFDSAPGEYGVEIKVGADWVRLGYQTTGWDQIQKPANYNEATQTWAPSPHSHPDQPADGVTSTAFGRDIGSMTGSHFAVWMTDNGFKLGRNTSSLRFKQNVRPYRVDPAKTLQLQAALFDRKPVLVEPAVGIGPVHQQPGRTDEWGLIAEEVFKLVPEMVTFYEDEIDGVRYDLLALALLDVVKAQDVTLKEQAQRLQAIEEKLGITPAGVVTPKRKGKADASK